MNDNRLKAMYVHPRAMLALFTDWWQYDSVHLPRFEGLAVDARVVAVEWSVPRHCWMLVIHSHDFPEVPLGHELPAVDAETVRLIVDRRHRVLREAR